ncbi:MAG: glycosyltransferase family 4 protein, partial [Rhodothermales bacterium]
PMDVQDLRDELGLNHQKVVLTISRLVPRKGIDTVLRALPQVAHQIPDVRYLIGGSGPDRDRLEALSRELHLSDRVQFLGNIPKEDLLRYYNACDVFVMPSREDRPHVEGFGIAFLEANACGKPVIGAWSGGIPDAVRDGETGLLVEPDDEADLAAAMLRLLRDAPLAARLGRNGRQRVRDEASWDHVADQLYEAIAARLEKDAFKPEI